MLIFRDSTQVRFISVFVSVKGENMRDIFGFIALLLAFAVLLVFVVATVEQARAPDRPSTDSVEKGVFEIALSPECPEVIAILKCPCYTRYLRDIASIASTHQHLLTEDTGRTGVIPRRQWPPVII